MILAAICARYHSHGLPGKAWRPMLGTPLMEYAIDKAFSSQCDEVVTSHDIPKSVWSYAVPHIPRPEHLTGPTVSKWDVWRHLAEEHSGADMIVDIDVTRPLTITEDVDGCIARLTEARERGLEGVMAIAQADKHPAFDILDAPGWGVSPYSRVKTEYVARQQLPPVYYHGGVYAITTAALRAYDSMWAPLWKGYEIPRARCFDVDDELDWSIVEHLMATRMHQVA